MKVLFHTTALVSAHTPVALPCHFTKILKHHRRHCPPHCHGLHASAAVKPTCIGAPNLAADQSHPAVCRPKPACHLKLASSTLVMCRWLPSPACPAPSLTGATTGSRPCGAPVNRVADPSQPAPTPPTSPWRWFFKKFTSNLSKFGCNLNRFD
jgi:hypothetical protein